MAVPDGGKLTAVGVAVVAAPCAVLAFGLVTYVLGI
jgi:hypothetical protein